QFKDPQAVSELSPEVPAEMVAVVERLMKKKPEERFGSVAELIEELRPLAGAAPPPRPQPEPRAAARPAPRDMRAPVPRTGAPEGKGKPAPPARPNVGPSEPTPRPPQSALPTRN